VSENGPLRSCHSEWALAHEESHGVGQFYPQTTEDAHPIAQFAIGGNYGRRKLVLYDLSPPDNLFRGSIEDSILKGGSRGESNGRHEETRTPDLYRVKSLTRASWRHTEEVRVAPRTNAHAGSRPFRHPQVCGYDIARQPPISVGMQRLRHKERHKILSRTEGRAELSSPVTPRGRRRPVAPASTHKKK
jgi:hypothetical protein